jgi:hypothetical protein
MNTSGLQEIIVSVILGTSPETGYRFNVGGKIPIGRGEKAVIKSFICDSDDNRVYMIVNHEGLEFYNRSFPLEMCQLIYDNRSQ